jgi:hypothetical protein
MNNIALAPKRTGRDTRLVTLLGNDVSMLRAELELMIDEDTYLKKIAGAAALLVARLDRVSLSGGTAMAAFTLAGLIDGMPEEMVSEAVSLLKSS